MKLQIASDLHLEFLQREFPGERLISPAYGADLLVLAGDIANGTDAIRLFNDWPVPVLYLAGNHEFYGLEFEETRVAMRNAARGTRVTLLDNDVADFGGVRFLGATLWTDYQLARDRPQQHLMEHAEQRIADHFRIRTGDGVFTAQRALAEHEISREWLAQQLATPYDGKTVVITHHGPHPLSVHPRYVGERPERQRKLQFKVQTLWKLEMLLDRNTVLVHLPLGQGNCRREAGTPARPHLQPLRTEYGQAT